MELISDATRQARRAAVALGAAAVTAGVALASSGSAISAGDATVADGPTIGAPVSQISSVAPDQAAAIGLLARPLGPGDAMTDAMVASQSSGGLVSAYGINPALARRAGGLADGGAWVIPGNGAICFAAYGNAGGVADANGGESCDTASDAIAGHEAMIASSQRAPGWLLVAGLVPDGVQSVTLTFADGSDETLPVSDNVYLTELQASAVPQVSFATGDGEVVPIGAGPLPAGSPASSAAG